MCIPCRRTTQCKSRSNARAQAKGTIRRRCTPARAQFVEEGCTAFAVAARCCERRGAQVGSRDRARTGARVQRFPVPAASTLRAAWRPTWLTETSSSRPSLTAAGTCSARRRAPLGLPDQRVRGARAGPRDGAELARRPRRAARRRLDQRPRDLREARRDRTPVRGRLTARRRRGRARASVEQALDLGHVHRLDEVVVDAGRERALAVLGLAVAGQRRQRGGAAGGAQAARDLVAV